MNKAIERPDYLKYSWRHRERRVCTCKTTARWRFDPFALGMKSKRALIKVCDVCDEQRAMDI